MTKPLSYSEIEYPKDESHPGMYPDLLCKYLVDRYGLRCCLLDVGCGKDYYVDGFLRYGINAIGIDKEFGYDLDENIVIPYENLHTVFTKSTIEHIRNTEYFLSEIYRVLKDEGLVICMTPNYLDQWKNFYDDPTHVHPFTQKGLEMAFKLAGFQNVHSEIFTQLPFFWKHPYLKFLLFFIRLLPDRFKYHNGKQNVLIRHAKERMILLWATK